MTSHAGSQGASALEVDGVTYTYLGRDRPSIADVSFALGPGTFTLIAGRTGSGKSTLLRALAGLIPHQAAGAMSGAVRICGIDTRGASPAVLASSAGLVLQSPDDQICTTSVENEMAFGLANLCLPAAEIEGRVTRWLDRMALSACRHQSTQTLSGGQKQRLLLASILAMKPGLLLLDEPLAQLDRSGAADLLDELNRLREEGLAIVVAEHRLDDLIATVDRVLVLDGGRLVADRMARDANLAQALDAAGLIVEPSAVPLVAAAPIPCGEKSQAAPVIEIAGLSQHFSRQEQPLWHDIHFRIDVGQRVAVVGENGSGKSTLLRVAAGLLRPTTGQVKVAAAPAGTSSLALVPQNPDLTLFCRTVYEELAFGPRQLGLSAREVHDRVTGVAEAVAIAALLDEPPLALSQGQRLRVAVAAAVTLRPRLLMLDEPTTGQDPIEVQRLMAAIADSIAAGQVGAVQFATHDVRIVAKFATRALILAERRVIADCAVTELLADADLLRRAGLRQMTLGAAPVAEIANPKDAELDIPRRARR